MTAPATPTPTRLFGRRSTVLAFIALAACFSFVALGTNPDGVTPDIGEFLNNPVRMLHGELPYRDFWLILAPGEVLLPAFLYELGFGFDGVMRLMAVVSVSIGLLAFAIARGMFGSDWLAALTACLVFFNGLTYHHQWFQYIHVYLLGALLGVGCLMRFASSGRARDLFFCGLFLGFGMSFRFYYAGGAAAACCLVLAWHQHHSGTPGSTRLAQAALLAAGLGVVPAAVSIFLHDVWGNMLRDVVVESVLHGTVRSMDFWQLLRGEAAWLLEAVKGVASGGTIGPIAPYLTIASTSLEAILSRTLIGVVLAGSFLWLRISPAAKNLPAGSKAGVLAFLVWGCLVFIRGYTRGPLSRLSHATTPWFFVLIFLWSQLRALSGPSATRTTRTAAAILLLVILGFGQHWIATTLRALGSASARSQQVVTPYGTLSLTSQQDAAIARDLVRLISEGSSADDYLFVTPKNAPPLYALTRRRNPTRFDSMVDLVYRPSEAKQREICAELADKRPALVVHTSAWGYGQDPALQFESSCPLLSACIAGLFEPLAQVGQFQVLRRRSPGAAILEGRKPDVPAFRSP
jgi:hypothetical protein